MEDPAGGRTGTGDADLMDRIRELEEDLTRTQEELARITSTDDEAAQEATDNDGPPSDDPDGEMAYKLAELVAASVTKVLKGDVNQHSSTPITAPIIVEVGGSKTIRMGGIPKADWSGLESPTLRVHSGQYRSLDRTTLETKNSAKQ
ncbi:unknown protein [Seminavis robusta]|uniref:Uncharacterized protein n=1 Tax=Seminavis robusta TaxID=568900 RepID=A0A9N8F465_9STRA|nr:unknown protein [Seminavis robusta]|eukprot:Sro3428_g347910.1 n/a (147) ;mRNA; f:5285-5725